MELYFINRTVKLVENQWLTWGYTIKPYKWSYDMGWGLNNNQFFFQAPY